MTRVALKINKPLSVPEDDIDELLEITNFEVMWHLMRVNMLKGMVQVETLCRIIVNLFSYVCILGMIYIVKLC